MPLDFHHMPLNLPGRAYRLSGCARARQQHSEERRIRRSPQQVPRRRRRRRRISQNGGGGRDNDDATVFRFRLPNRTE